MPKSVLTRPKKLTIRLRALEMEMLKELAESRGSLTATFARSVLLDAIQSDRADPLHDTIHKGWIQSAHEKKERKTGQRREQGVLK